jgi:putative peptidoglycan lipid II flippase
VSDTQGLARPARGALTTGREALERFVPPGAILLSILSFSGYAMGLVRDRVFARTYGAGIELDAYNAAFVLPELFFDVLVASGLTAPFVPILLSLRRDDTAGAEEFGQTVLTTLVFVMGVVTVILFVIAPWTATFIVPGFDAAERELYVELFRVMCVTAVIFSASLLFGELLVADRRFLAYGLAPLLYNGGIVAGTLLLADRIGIFAAAVGAVVGALLHLGVRLLGVLRTSFRIRARLATGTQAFREFVRLMIPRMLSHPIEPITFLFYTAIATTLVDGGVSAVSFARNFQSVAVSLIGVAFSLAIFPTLSTAWAAGERGRFISALRRNVLTIGALTTLAAIGLVILGGTVIELFLGGGAFDAEDVALTTSVLTAFAISVPLESLTYPLARAIYATHNTILQVLASLAGLGVLVVTCLALTPEVGLLAIPLSFAAGNGTKVVLLGLALGWRLRRAPPDQPSTSGSGASPTGVVGTTEMNR